MIPVAKRAKQLWLYWDYGLALIWASSPEEARRATKSRRDFIRVSHKDHRAPAGYWKCGGYLANDPVEPDPSLRRFVKTVTKELR